MANVRATSMHGGSSDEMSGVRTPPSEKPSSSSSSSRSKVNIVHPEVVSVQKDHMTLLLAKCRNQESQLQAYKNLQLVIKDAYTQLQDEKKKSAKYQTALIQAENRLTEMVRVQLENSALQHQLPFLADVQRKPVGRATRLPAGHSEEHRVAVTEKPKTEPLISSELGNDIEIDGEATQDSAYVSSSIRNSHPYSSIGEKQPASLVSSQSFRTDVKSSLEVDGTTDSLALSPSEYEVIIEKERHRKEELKLEVKQLQSLLEAKSNNNMDALTTQLREAQRKIDTLSTANKNKETLLQNYYQAYMTLSKQKPQQDVAAAADDALENCSKDQLQHIILQMRAHEQKLRDMHETHLCEQRGLFLKEREKSNALEAKLKSCQQTIDDLRARRSGWDKGDFPLTLSELRERNQYLEDTIKLHQGSSIKLSQEKERAIAAYEMATSELGKVKKERAELEKQVKQLSEKLQDPSSEKNTLQAKLAAMEQRMGQLQTEIVRTEKAAVHQRVHQLEKKCSELQKKNDNLKSHTENQQRLIISLQSPSTVRESVVPVQADEGYSTQYSFHTPQQHQPQHQPQQTRAADKSSSYGDGVGDNELLECPRCLKEFPIEQVEKYQLHCQRCQDDE